MDTIKRLPLFLLLLFYSIYTVADQPNGSVYLDGGDSKIGLILAHGQGQHPTWEVVDPLRKAVNQELGFHTLSLQLPNDEKNWKAYAARFPDAYKVFDEGVNFLVNIKGVDTIYLLGHSMGSRMASAYLVNSNQTKIKGLVVIGCRNNGKVPLSCIKSLKKLQLPVLDIWGGKSEKDYKAGKERKSLVSARYTQSEIAGANHTFEQSENQLVNAVIDWLKIQP